MRRRLAGLGDVAVFTCGDRFTSPITRDAEGNVERFAPTNVMYVVQIRGDDVTRALSAGPDDALMTKAFFQELSAQGLCGNISKV